MKKGEEESVTIYLPADRYQMCDDIRTAVKTKQNNGKNKRRKQDMLQTMIAIEQDGRETHAISLLFEVPDKDFDLKGAVYAAATEFCQTEEGRRIYDYNCSCFNWADFSVSVPNEFCEKHGFKKVDSVLGDIVVDWDEHIVNDSVLEEDEE